MFKKVLFKLFIALFPESLMLTGSLLLSFALKLVNTQNLWEQEQGVVNGGITIGDVGMNMPVQNDTLFWWGFILFIIGSALEFLKITYFTIKKVKAEEAVASPQKNRVELKKARKASKKT